jgi:hypothetical protein
LLHSALRTHRDPKNLAYGFMSWVTSAAKNDGKATANAETKKVKAVGRTFDQKTNRSKKLLQAQLDHSPYGEKLKSLLS